MKCPGCGEVLEVDVARGKVLSHKKGQHPLADRKEGEDGLDAAMRHVKSSKDRIQSEFEQAQDQLRNQSQRLDQLFREAQKKAREDHDTGPEQKT